MISSVVEVDADAVGDLRRIRATSAVAFAKLYSLVEQMRVDPSIVSRLLDHDYGADQGASFSVSKWIKVWRVAPLWRLKFWSLEKAGLRYRIIYVHDWRNHKYVILAIVPREEFDYDDPTNPIRRRVLERCREDFGNL